MSSYLNFNCPSCNHKYSDDLEVLDIDVLHDFKCENCAKPFVMMNVECMACSKDTTFVWREKPGSETLSALQCENCVKLLYPVEEPEQED